MLDVLAHREPWFEHSAAVLSFVDEMEIEGYLAAHSVTTLSYLLAKHRGLERTAAALIDLLGLLRAVNVDHERLLQALSLGWRDFEDAVQAVCALSIDADYLITRDPKGFPALSIPVVTPSETLAVLAG